MLHENFHVIYFYYSLLIRCFPSSAWETIPQAPLAVTGSRASVTAFPSRAWEGAKTAEFNNCFKIITWFYRPVSGNASRRRREYIPIGLGAASMPRTLLPALPDTSQIGK